MIMMIISQAHFSLEHHMIKITDVEDIDIDLNADDDAEDDGEDIDGADDDADDGEDIDGDDADRLEPSVLASSPQVRAVAVTHRTQLYRTQM